MAAADYILPGICTIAGAATVWYGFNRMHKHGLIQDTPSSKIRSMAMGLVEISGTVEADKPLVTPFSQSTCVFYRYKIEEYRAHTSKDSKGRSTTTYNWDTISSGEQRAPFWARDDTGKAYVDPEGAEIDVPVKKVFIQKAGVFGAVSAIVNALKSWDSRKQSALDVPSWRLTPIDPKQSFSFGNSVGDRKYYEYYIEPGEILYVLGTAAPDQKKPLIKKGENEPTFIISNKSEKEMLGSLKWQMLGSFLFGALLLIAGLVLLLKTIGAI